MKLSPNFTLQELTRTSTGLPNEPKPEHLPRLIALAATLEKVRALFNRPIVVSSGYRSDAVNAKVGGSKTSAHSLGYAADFTVNGLSVREVCEKLVQSNIKFDQLIDEKRGNTTWIHLSIDPRMRGQVLTFRNGTYTQGLT
jgi:putative chitinase